MDIQLNNQSSLPGRVLSTYQPLYQLCDNLLMKNSNIYAGYRYPAQIISHTVWLYHRFTLSFRDIEELLAARGVVVTYETIRQWCKKVRQYFLQADQKIVTNPLIPV